MPSPSIIARTIRNLQRSLDDYRDRKATIALVPTMGALHDGHMSLLRPAKPRARWVIVSIFVNPTQFAPTEDYGAYHRTWKADVARLAAEAVDIVWNPDVKTMYPDGFATRIVCGRATTGRQRHRGRARRWHQGDLPRRFRARLSRLSRSPGRRDIGVGPFRQRRQAPHLGQRQGSAIRD